MNFKEKNYLGFFQKFTNETLISYYLLIMALITIVFTVFTLNKGFIMRDEGWYMYLLKDMPDEVTITKFFLFFKNIFEGNIFSVRISVFITDLISISIFSIGLFSYFHKRVNMTIHSFIILLSLSAIGLTIGYIIVGYVFCYTWMIREFALISIGFIFLSYNKSGVLSKLFLAISGFFIGFLFFTMITTTVTIVLTVVVLFLSKESRRNILWYLLGIILSFCFYFLMIESITVFFTHILNDIGKTLNNEYNSNHGSKFMLTWIVDTCLYFIYEVFPVVLSILGLLYFRERSTKKYFYCIFLLFIIYVLYYYFINVVFPINKSVSIVPFLAFLVLVLFNVILECKKSFTHVLLLLVPFSSIMLAFGSDTQYSICTRYLVFIIPPTYIFIKYLDVNQKKYWVAFIALITFYFINYLSLPFRNNWADIKYTKQIIPVSTLGINQNIQLDIFKVNELRELKEAGVLKENVILSSIFSWGYCYLLDCKPVSYEFKFLEESALCRLKTFINEKELILVEEKKSPHFTEFFIQKVYIEFNAKKIIKKETSIHNLYFLSKD